jgi:hypothetical protein
LKNQKTGERRRTAPRVNMLVYHYFLNKKIAQIDKNYRVFLYNAVINKGISRTNDENCRTKKRRNPLEVCGNHFFAYS